MGGGGTSILSSPRRHTHLTLFTANVAYHDTMDDLGTFETGASFGNFTYSDFTAINNAGAGNGATVSPKDLLYGTDSVPPSTAFTNLTTPGSTFLDTPDSYQASPLFSDNLGDSFGDALDFGTGDNTTSFFQDFDSLMNAPPMQRTESGSSNAQIVVHPGGPAHMRKRSSANSPSTFAARPSSVAGVSAKKRDKPLPPIMVDENDSIALKRARNTAAARKSRAKKVEEKDTLEGRIADLEAQLAESSRELNYWKVKAQGGGDESLDN
jgi:general control protein GCN4